MSSKTVGIISPPWLTASGQPELVEVVIEGEGAVARLAEAAGMSIEEAQGYLDTLETLSAEYRAAERYGGVGHA